ncbi:hypothetical protein BJX96DRAFT_163644 [Aspergillus floccosus]
MRRIINARGPETLSIFASLASFIGIVVVLCYYNGRPMPDWPYGVTLNAVLSILSTVMKATMALCVSECLGQLKWSWFQDGHRLSDLTLIDSASRGVAGAVYFLLKTLPRHLITFGCLIIVLAITTEPFVQQVVAIEQKLIPAEDLASIQICNASMYKDFTHGGGPGLNALPLHSLGALYSGLFRAQGYSSMTSAMQCPSGNCTFGPYQSLGICSRCANITELLHGSKRTFAIEGDEHLSSYDPYYYYELPNGLAWNSSERRLINTRTDVDLLRLNSSNTALITNFSAIALTIDSLWSEPPSGWGGSPKLNATECMLYFCVRSYEAAVHAGGLSENTTSISSYSNYSSSAPLNNIFLTPNECYFNATRQKAYGDNEHCAYMLSPFSHLAMRNTITPLLKGHGGSINSLRKDWSSDTIEAIYGEEGSLADISSVFESIATALTNNARTNVCKTAAQGTTWMVQSFVAVRWQWLTLPAFLLVLSTSFLIATIVQTRNQYIWKTSPLALLFSDIFIHDTSSVKFEPNFRQMDHTARRTKVRLETSSGSIKFSAESNSS